MSDTATASDLYEIPQEIEGLPRHDPPDRPGEDRSAGRRHRPRRRVPARHPRAARRAGHPGTALRRGVRGDRHRNADAADGGRGDRQGLRLERPDPDGPGARLAADRAVRLRRAEAEVAAAPGDGRDLAGLRPERARGRLGPRRDAHQRRPGRRRVGDQRPKELDHERRRSPTTTSSSPRPTARPTASPPSSSRPTARASTPASSSTSWGSRARRPASRASPTSGCRTRT